MFDFVSILLIISESHTSVALLGKALVNRPLIKLCIETCGNMFSKKILTCTWKLRKSSFWSQKLGIDLYTG